MSFYFNQRGKTPSPRHGHSQVPDGPDGGATEAVAAGEGGGHDVQVVKSFIKL